MTNVGSGEKATGQQQLTIRAVGPDDDYAARLETHIRPLEVFKQNPKFYVRLKMNLEQQSYYEAHQLFKTIHFRCSASEQLLNDSLELVYFGIVYFGNRSQIYCAFDLSKVFIETLKKAPPHRDQIIDDKLADQIQEIHKSLRSGAEERSEFTAAILKWSQSLYQLTKQTSQITKSTIYRTDQPDSLAHYSLVYQKNFGNFLLQLKIAHNLWNEKLYAHSRYHFLHSLDGVSFAKMIIEFQTNFGYPSETDLFLAQNVLQYLCVRNLDSAQQFFDHFVSQHPRLSSDAETEATSSKLAEARPVKGVFREWPLINFVNFLLHAIRRGNLAMFQKLKQIYKPSLDKDPAFHEYLDRIGQYFFALKSAKPQSGNMFSNLIKMLVSPEAPGEAAVSEADSSLDDLQRKMSRKETQLKSRNILDDDEDEDEEVESDDQSYGDIDDTDVLD